MPYVLPRFATKSNDLAFVLAFGDLSYLELCTVFEDRLVRSRRPWTDIAIAEFKEGSGGFEKLAGIHKAVVPITKEPSSWSASLEALKRFLGDFDRDFNFSVSVYSPDATGEQQYEDVLADVLATVRERGFRKSNLIRPKGGSSEMLGREIVTRKIIDFIVIQLGSRFWLGATSFVPDVEQFQVRSNERPVVSSEISVSSRLARLLLNLSGVSKGQTVLDPFCGSGTILAEAVMVGANCIGVDRDPGRIENTRRNLEWLSQSLGRTNQVVSLGVGDALKLHDVLGDTRVDAVVTEPILLPKIDHAPPPENARKMIKNSSILYSEALYSIAGAVKRGGRVVIVTPSLRTSTGRDVSVLLEGTEEVGLRPFRSTSASFDYPVRISHEKTKWVKRLVYVFERA